MENKKNKILTLIAIITILLTLIGATYAFFAAQSGGTTSTNAIVTSNTTDLLTFVINQDISFHVTQADFAQGGNNKSGDATATATLTPNNNTGAATDHYYMYLNIINNGIVYSSTNTNEDPELMVQVFDGSNQLVTCPSLGEQVTIKGVTGYDITGVQGPVALLNNHEIIANNNTAAIENWRVVITVINLDVNQNDNTGKEVTANLVLQKNSMNSIPQVTEQECDGEPCGSVESVIEPTKNLNDDDIFTIYTVGYLTGDETSTTYSIDIRNLGVDLRLYTLELDGTPQVMTTQADYNTYMDRKNNGVPTTTLTSGNENRAVATSEEMYTYSLDASELTINNVSISCNMTRCIATISESFNNISNKTRHATETENGDQINVLYNGIKFSLKKKRVTLWASQLEYSNPTYTSCEESQCAIDELYGKYNTSVKNLTLGLTKNQVAGLYRYQGVKADNFICFGTTNKNTCLSDTDKYMYRIIGVNTSGQMKLIKKEALNTAYSWSTKCSSVQDWPDEIVTNWSNSNLYEGLNGSYFLTNSNYVPSGWENRIATVNWKYGDLSSSNLTPTQIAANELGFTNTVSAKIGLMYLHDYIYALPDGNNCGNDGYCKPSWIYLSKLDNDNTNSPVIYEWFMTRNSLNSLCNSLVWGVQYDNMLIKTFLSNDTLSVRPVFYLIAGQEIASGDGTLTNPFILY